MEQQILQHLLHNQLTEPRDSQIDNDSIDRIQAELEGATDVAKTSDLVTSWIPNTNGSAISIFLVKVIKYQTKLITSLYYFMRIVL